MFRTVTMLMASTAMIITPSLNGAATMHQPPEGYQSGRCILEVDGKTYMSGRCYYEMADDGSFEIHPASNTNLYAQVSFFKGVAKGHWNDSFGADFQGDLGILKRRGACWVNKRARICLWRNDWRRPI